MKRISCIFGRHWYKPSEIELYIVEKKPHSNVYRAIARCMYCGKENEQLIEIPLPLCLRDCLRWERSESETD